MMNCGFALMAAVMATMTPQAVPPEARRLSDLEIERVLADAAAKRESAEQKATQPSRQVQGELGVAVGTGSYRSAFGTAFVPLGDKSGATLSFSTDKGGEGYSGGYDEHVLSRRSPR